LIAEAGRKLRAATETIEDENDLLNTQDIHLRIRTLIAEAGKKLRAVHGTIEDEKAADS
jgi:hypothetical protein